MRLLSSQAAPKYISHLGILDFFFPHNDVHKLFPSYVFCLLFLIQKICWAQMHGCWSVAAKIFKEPELWSHQRPVWHVPIRRRQSCAALDLRDDDENGLYGKLHNHHAVVARLCREGMQMAGRRAVYGHTLGNKWSPQRPVASRDLSHHSHQGSGSLLPGGAGQVGGTLTCESQHRIL